MKFPSRRGTLAGLSGFTGIVALSGTAAARGLGDGAFTHGVASGDPTTNAVIIWTRFVPKAAVPGPVRWQVARDEGFSRIVAQGSQMRAERRVEVAGVEVLIHFAAGVRPSLWERLRRALGVA